MNNYITVYAKQRLSSDITITCIRTQQLGKQLVEFSIMKGFFRPEFFFQKAQEISLGFVYVYSRNTVMRHPPVHHQMPSDPSRSGASGYPSYPPPPLQKPQIRPSLYDHRSQQQQPPQSPLRMGGPSMLRAGQPVNMAQAWRGYERNFATAAAGKPDWKLQPLATPPGPTAFANTSHHKVSKSRTKSDMGFIMVP